MNLEQLLKECRKGRLTAQKQLFELFVVQMFLLCRRYVKNDSIAEECMMNGFLKFFQSLHKFTYNDEQSSCAFIKKIMVNECLQQIRQNKTFLMVAESEAEENTIDEEAITNLSAEEIYKLLLQLPAGYRTVFNLYVFEGMRHKEIADALGIKEGTSKSQLNKAKQMLQQLLITNDAEYATRRAR